MEKQNISPSRLLRLNFIFGIVIISIALILIIFALTKEPKPTREENSMFSREHPAVKKAQIEISSNRKFRSILGENINTRFRSNFTKYYTGEKKAFFYIEAEGSEDKAIFYIYAENNNEKENVWKLFEIAKMKNGSGRVKEWIYTPIH